MALSLVKTAIVDPSRQQIDTGAYPLDAVVYTVDITVGATSDYSSGIDLTSTALIGQGLSDTPVGAVHLPVSKIIGVLGASVRSSGGTGRAFTGVFNQNTNKLQFFKSATGVLATTTTSQAIVGAGTETIVALTSLAANTLSTNGQSLRITCGGPALGANANTKTIKFNLGGTGSLGGAITGGFAAVNVATAANAKVWWAQGTIVRTGAATQVGTGYLLPDATALAVSNTTGGTQDFTTALQLNITGASSGAAADVTLNYATFELLGASVSPIEIAPGDLSAGDIVRATVVAV